MIVLAFAAQQPMCARDMLLGMYWKVHMCYRGFIARAAHTAEGVVVSLPVFLPTC